MIMMYKSASLPSHHVSISPFCFLKWSFTGLGSCYEWTHFNPKPWPSRFLNLSESEIKRVKQRQNTNESSEQRLDRQRRRILWCSRKEPNKGRCSIVTRTKRRSVLFTSPAHTDIPGVHQHGNLMLAPSLDVESKRRVSFHPLAHFSRLFYLQRHPPPHPQIHTYIHFVCPSSLCWEKKKRHPAHILLSFLSHPS